MDRRQKELVATIEDEVLKVLVPSSPAELESAELQLVAGGAGVIIDPNG